jgi:hypothetical protein
VALAPSAPSLAASSDSGIVGDGITNVTQPTFTGTATAADVVNLYDAAGLLGTATVGSSGVWSITAAQALAAGTYSLFATATDGSGNQSPDSALFALTIDTQAPAAPAALILAAASGDGVAGQTLSTTPTISGTAVAGDTVSLYSNGSFAGSAVASAAGAWSITVATALALGVQDFTATATDVAGNVSTASPVLAVSVVAPLIFNLGPGNTYVLAATAGEIINGNTAGVAQVDLTAATMGVTITGHGGVVDLVIQGGGIEVMGANQTGITAVYLKTPGSGQPANLFTANVQTGLHISASLGNDTVTVGDVSQNVLNSGGVLQVLATSAQAGVWVNSTLGQTTLEITTAGTANLNPRDTNLTVRLYAAATLNLDGLRFITAIGSGGGDLIQAGGANQTLMTGGGLGDTLTGYAGFGDTFKDTSANLNGVTIGKLGGNDAIDLTDLLPGSASYVFNAGTLTVTDGTHTAAITLLGSFSTSGFLLQTDNHGGTSVTYR